MYAGQSLPYSYAPTTSAPSQPGYISPPESRRILEDDKEKPSGRQSLPSIHEALGNDNHLPYPAPTSAPPPQSGHTAPPPSHLIGRSGAEGPSGPPNPFSNGPATGSLMREPGYPAHPTQIQVDASRTSLASINTQESRNTSLHSKSPTQSAKTGFTSVSGSQNSSAYDYSAPPSAGSVASPNGYSHFTPNYSFPPSQQHQQPPPPPGGPSYPPAHYDNRAYMGAPRVEEVKGGFVGRPMPGQPHSDSVKRHLDVYDVETSLNEVWFRLSFSVLFVYVLIGLYLHLAAVCDWQSIFCHSLVRGWGNSDLHGKLRSVDLRRWDWRCQTSGCGIGGLTYTSLGTDLRA